MRRDVRLLGDILGEVIRDSAGPGLLADVERLRHAVIDARRGWREDDPDRGDPTPNAIAGLVASWTLERAEQVARAFTVYFHLANLAEEHQRIRILRERDTGQEPVRESLAAAVAEVSREAGPGHLAELLESLRVHLVLTAHPTEARGVPWWRRCARPRNCAPVFSARLLFCPAIPPRPLGQRSWRLPVQSLRGT